jgi:phosphoglycerate dehydrogenase-like enzyme
MTLAVRPETWDADARAKVLIETQPGFTPSDWRRTFDAEFADWRRGLQVRFGQTLRRRWGLAPDMDVYVGTSLSEETLARARRLRWIHMLTAGRDSMGLPESRGDIRLTTSSGAASAHVAEHVAGLMIALDRRFDLAIARQKHWVWQQGEVIERIRGVRNRTVGIVGLGNNGRAVAELLRAMGMRVIGITRSPISIEGVEVLSGALALTRLLELSDFLVLCVPLTPETHHMIGSAELRALGPESFLINVARGAVVDEVALGIALREGLIAGAGVDVLSIEPPPRRHPLRGCPNLIVTPHAAGNIFTVRQEIRRETVRRLREFAAGESTLDR